MRVCLSFPLDHLSWTSSWGHKEQKRKEVKKDLSLFQFDAEFIKVVRLSMSDDKKSRLRLRHQQEQLLCEDKSQSYSGKPLKIAHCIKTCI